MCTNYGASRNDAAFTDPNAWENDASQTDPHTVSDDHGTHVIRIWREPRPSRLRIGRMAVGVHNDSAAGQVTIAPQRDALANSEVTVVADFGTVTNFQQRVVGKPHRKGDRDLAIQCDVVAENNVPFTLDPVNVAIGVQALPVFLAIGL